MKRIMQRRDRGDKEAREMLEAATMARKHEQRERYRVCSEKWSEIALKMRTLDEFLQRRQAF